MAQQWIHQRTIVNYRDEKEHCLPQRLVCGQIQVLTGKVVHPKQSERLFLFIKSLNQRLQEIRQNQLFSGAQLSYLHLTDGPRPQQ